MGYTHYWYQRRDFTQGEWGQICEAAAALLPHAPVCLEYDEPNQPPAIDGECIAFNGRRDAGHETFYMTRKRRDLREYERGLDNSEGAFNFCKTAQKPYDSAVCAILAVAAQVAPDAITVRSDGDYTDWQAPLRWAAGILGDSLAFPLREAADQ